MTRLFTLLLLFPAALAFAQSAQLTPVSDLGMHTVTVGVPAKFAGSFASGRTLNVLADYTASVYYSGSLNNPRFMAFSPLGVLHVSDMGAGKVYAMPDNDNDGVADTIITVASGFSNNHDVRFYKGAMYVTETTRIWKCTDTDGDGIYETKTIFINNIGNNQTNGHVTRTLVFDSLNQKAYVSVGSSCNVCREANRATIEQYNDDGTGRRVFATGARNAIGMAIHPVTNRLWANNNGSDEQGNEIPPEWIDLVRENGFYGHPLAYGSGVWFDFNATTAYQALLPITAADTANVARLIMPAALVRAHSAPMALTFLNPDFGSTMQYGFLCALRGSWNTTNPPNFRGFKVVYGHLSSPQDTTVDYIADFCSGFLTDTVNRVFWGRPVGVTIGNNGKVYISSVDAGRFILVLTPNQQTGVQQTVAQPLVGTVYPNPAQNSFTISLNLANAARVTATLYDMSGRELSLLMDQVVPAGACTQQLNVRNIAGGYYLLKVTANGKSFTERLLLKE